MVVHIITAGLTGYMLYLAAPGSDLFSWHPTCMTIAFALLITQAIVIFSPESSLTQNSTRGDKVQLHWILNVFGLFAVAAGFGSIYLNKEIAAKKHFMTWHGKFGLATIVGVVLAAVGGIAAKYSSSLRNYVRPINIKLYHGTGGMLVFICAMVTMCLACYSNWFKKRADGFIWRCVFWCPVVLAVCVARQVTQSYLPRVASATPVSQTNVKEKTVLKSGKEKKKNAKEGSKTNKTFKEQQRLVENFPIDPTSNKEKLN